MDPQAVTSQIFTFFYVSVIDSVHECFQQAQEKRAIKKHATESQAISVGSCDYLVMDACSSDSQGSDQLFERFDSYWEHKRPIVIRNLHRHLNQQLWSPESFNQDFGHLTVDLVNCKNHYIVPGVEMKKFWIGFENVQGRNRI